MREREQRKTAKQPSESDVKWITDLKGKHEGEIGIVCGNGWSMGFYDPAAMKAAGCVLLGCNQLYERIPYLDYLTFMDAHVIPSCLEWPGNKIMDFRKLAHREFYLKADLSNVYFFYSGRFGTGKGDKLEASNSGCLALQVARVMEFKTIILVGCDCEFMDVEEDLEYRSNIFKDRQVLKTIDAKRRRKNKKKILEQVTNNGEIKFTNNILHKFAHKFEQLYRRFRYDVNIFRMGTWGIVDIPSVDFPEFYSDEHPSRR